MKKFLLGLASGFALAALAAVIFVFALMRAGDRRPSVPDGSIIVMRLEGDIPEQAPVTIPLPWFQSQVQPTMAEMWSLLRTAGRDDKIKGLLLEPQGLGVGWARLEELRAGIRQFKKSGKPVYAYLRSPGAREYMLAVEADKVYFNPEDILDLKGIRAELQFYKRTLDKVGVELEVEHAGKYKDAADQFTRSAPTPETREVINSMLDQLFGYLVGTVASGRKLEPARVRSLIDEGPFIDDAAVSAKLIDGLRYEEQAREELKKQLKLKTLERISHRDYLRSAAMSTGGSGDNRIALVVGEGTILRMRGDPEPFTEEAAIRSGPFMRLLQQVRDDDSIKGVILRVNSPGGDAIASDEILHEVKNLSRKKPMVVSMSDLAASGGYYIAMSGDPVLAYPNTITGSIGVIYGKANLQELYNKVGIDTEIMKRGEHADFGTASKPMSEAARKKLREGIDSTYQAFLKRVAEGRKRPVSEIEPLAQGRVWMGAQAKNNRLVDQLGGLDEAIELVRQRAKIPANERIRLVPFPRKRTLFEELFNPGESVFARLAPPTAEAAAMQAVRQWTRSLGLTGLDPELWSRGGFFCLPPFSLRIQ